MEFGLTAAQAELREVARRYLAGRYPPERIATLADSAAGYADDGWDPIVRSGWLDPDLGMVERAVLAEESGYALHPVPWWSTVGLAVPGDSPQVPTTLGWYDERSSSLAQAHYAAACRAETRPDGGWRISGTKRLVPDLAGAHRVTLTAATEDGVALFRVAPGHPGVEVTPRTCLDGLRRVGDLGCADAAAELVTGPAGTPEALRRLRRRALALLAAEAVGVARRAYDIATAHAKVRIQFDRPIGSYQGVSFRIADSYVALELARSLAYRAAWLTGQAATVDGNAATVDEAGATVDEAVSCATVAGREAAVGCCEHAIQVLGGIAMTWEHPLHRWYRRALWLRAFDAGSAQHREDLAGALLADSP